MLACLHNSVLSLFSQEVDVHFLYVAVCIYWTRDYCDGNDVVLVVQRSITRSRIVTLLGQTLTIGELILLDLCQLTFFVVVEPRCVSVCSTRVSQKEYGMNSTRYACKWSACRESLS